MSGATDYAPRTVRAGPPYWIAASLLGYAILFVPQILNDPDSYWHIKAGQWILQHRTVPLTDPFSYTFAGRPWVAHEWLSEVLMALAWRAASWDGVVILFGLVTAAAFGLLAYQLTRRLAPVISLLVFAVVAACVSPSLLLRPHLLVLPLLVLWLSGLSAALERGRAPAPLLLTLVPLWANLHGSVIFGLALILPFGIDALLQAGTERPLRARQWGTFLAAAVALSLLTPQGWHGLLFPFQLVGMRQVALVTEWRPPDFQQLQPLEIGLLLTLYAAFTRPLRLSIPALLTLLAVLHLALQHSRHQMLAGVVGAFVLARPLGEAWRGSSGAGRFARRIWVFAGAGLALLMTVLRLHHPIVRGDDASTPGAALDHVPAELRQQPVFNDYGFGGYLIFRDIKPFIDGRADLYGDAFLTAYMAAVAPQRTAFRQAVDQYGIRWAIFSAGAPVLEMMDTLPGWRRLYADRIAVVYVRQRAEAAGGENK